MQLFMNYAPWLKIFLSLITFILQKIFNWNLAYLFIGTRHILLSRPRTPDTFMNYVPWLIFSTSNNLNTMKAGKLKIGIHIHWLWTCPTDKACNSWCIYSWIMPLWLKIFLCLITLILQKIFNWNFAYIFIGTRHILLSRPRTPDTFIHELVGYYFFNLITLILWILFTMNTIFF